MTNKEIANQFNELAKMMELHEEDPYRIRSYQNAYIQLRKVESPLTEMSAEDIGKIKGVGKTISGKIKEIVEEGQMAKLVEYKAKTPEGVQEMLGLKGFGPKKILQLWKELDIESLGELWYACNENRLIELKGFGAKTQEELKKKVEYFQQSKGKFHYAALEPRAIELLKWLQENLSASEVSLVGEMGRLCPIVNGIEILLGREGSLDDLKKNKDLVLDEIKEQVYSGTFQEAPVKIYTCLPEAYGSKRFRYMAAEPFLTAFMELTKKADFKNIATEEALFAKAKLPYILPELREDASIIKAAKSDELPSELIRTEDIKGVVHTHTTYSDGLHTLEQMVNAAKEKGFEYITITDHSKSAFYANGLKPDRVLEQMEAIDQLNAKLKDFKIFKGIESDILNDGSLDYEDSMLKQFDLIIASVHSNLKMDEEKATKRLITAIENPYTSILGHPTGRLLLSRKGYPIDHEKVIDACAKNGVSIELNANPYRLDIDYTWIPYAMNKGVQICINPDAHSMEGIDHIRYGVLAARKGRLTAAYCLNARGVEAFEAFISSK